MARRKYEIDKKELEEISARLRAAIAYLDINVTDIEKEAKVPASTIHKYLSGKVYVSGKLLKYLCDKGVNVCWVLTGKGQLESYP